MTDRYAVIGNPVAHSKSPEIHRLFARQTGQDIDYVRLLAPLDGFKSTVQSFIAQGGRGANVTVPFKLEAFDLAHQVSKRAKDARAANFLKFEDGQVLADNTDGHGLVQDIVTNLGFPVAARRVLLMGAGGAAQGVLVAPHASSWLHEDGFAHISTGGGAELGCCVAIKVLEITQRPEVRANVLKVADFFTRELARVRALYPDFFVGVRQNGVIMGLEFDHPEGAKFVMRRLYENGVWAIFSQLDPRVLQWKPGLLKTEAECREIVEILDQSIEREAELRTQEGVDRARAAGLDAEGSALESEAAVWQAVLSAAAERDAAVIVSGARGIGGARSALLGSVSSGLVNHAELPVLVVPGRASEHGPPSPETT